MEILVELATDGVLENQVNAGVVPEKAKQSDDVFVPQVGLDLYFSPYLVLDVILHQLLLVQDFERHDKITRFLPCKVHFPELALADHSSDLEVIDAPALHVNLLIHRSIFLVFVWGLSLCKPTSAHIFLVPAFRPGLAVQLGGLLGQQLVLAFIVDGNLFRRNRIGVFEVRGVLVLDNFTLLLLDGLVTGLNFLDPGEMRSGRQLVLHGAVRFSGPKVQNGGTNERSAY